MGNNATKEARTTVRSQPSPTGVTLSSSSYRPQPTPRQSDNTNDSVSSRRRGNSRHDLSLFRLGGGHHDPDPSDPMARRETRAEREARKRQKERELRALERERSMKEEGVDGGFLVTLGTYTGPEDFSKTTVRQLQVERRLAPFWKGLQDHDDSWADNQLIALVRGEKLPEPGPTPTLEQLTAGAAQSDNLGVPGASIDRPRSPSNPERMPASMFSTAQSSSFRTRAKTLVSMSTPRSSAHPDASPAEVTLPKDPYVNGKPLEVFLYRDAAECPICFLYYPPYLNKTRCCDQPICSECFVQIKRPDPHPPEHHDDDPAPATPSQRPEAEYELVSEPATCPFCKQPEFGITYDAPPFRRGIVYGDSHRLGSLMSAMSSSSSLNSHSPSSANRRRGTSLAVDAPNVIMTDTVRPDWRKKLDDARSHALRRAAAATALHNAAYVLGNQTESGPRLPFARRRRTLFGDNGSSNNGSDGLGFPQVSHLLTASDRHGSQDARDPASDQTGSDLFPPRGTSRRSRVEDLEELMYMEAIRLSLASAEEERKKQEKEEERKQKKEDKQRAKDAKKARKETIRSSSGGSHSVSDGGDASSVRGGMSSQAASGASPVTAGKGKGPVEAALGWNPMTEPTNTLKTELSKAPKDNPQAHLEQSRQNMSLPVPVPVALTAFSAEQAQAARNFSSASSISSANDSNEPSPSETGLQLDQASSSAAGPYGETPPGGGAGTEPMFNFRSLAAVIGDEDDKGPVIDHFEHATTHPSALAQIFAESGDSSASMPPKHSHGIIMPTSDCAVGLTAGERLFGVLTPPEGLSPPKAGVASALSGRSGAKAAGTAARDLDDGGPLTPQGSNPYDKKNYGDIGALDSMGVGSHA